MSNSFDKTERLRDVVKRAKAIVRRIHDMCLHWFSTLFFDPKAMFRAWWALPFFVRNLVRYARLNNDQHFPLNPSALFLFTQDRSATAGFIDPHYFFQDIWAARHVFDSGCRRHVDIASRVDGFVAHCLPFCRVTYVDLRPLNIEIEGFEYCSGSIMALPFRDGSCPSVSCLHVIEHIGLGRYGDTVDPSGYGRAAGELIRILADGGTLLLSVPVGRERLCFDAHRIFDPETITDLFQGLKLREFSLVPDSGTRIIRNAQFSEVRESRNACGLYRFQKPQAKMSIDE
jgi:Caenorhabditis protein of unknown function, DUF268